jgi:integrase
LNIFIVQELEGRKTNHSTRKTFATDLLDADIPNTELEVTQLGGWKSMQTLIFITVRIVWL